MTSLRSQKPNPPLWAIDLYKWLLAVVYPEQFLEEHGKDEMLETFIYDIRYKSYEAGYAEMRAILGSILALLGAGLVEHIKRRTGRLIMPPLNDERHTESSSS